MPLTLRRHDDDDDVCHTDDASRRLLNNLRAAAWQLLAAAPEEAHLPAEAEACDGVRKVTVRLSGAEFPHDLNATGQGGREAVALLRFVLSPIECAIFAFLAEAGGKRYHLPDLRDGAEKKLGRRVGEGPMKTLLARLTKCGLLVNRDRCGYELSEQGRTLVRLLAADKA